MPLKFTFTAGSDVGLIRDGNEDSALLSPRLVAVADGMGGHAGGEVASKIAIRALGNLSELLNETTLDSGSREDLLLNISYVIDDAIAKASKGHLELQGMGTTLTAIHLNESSLELLHIGDSRCYRWDNSLKKLEQISIDHTVMQELIVQGRLTPEEVFDHPQRSLLTQALMGDSGIDPVLQVFNVNIGDQFLLCSDGLNAVLSDLDIQKIIQSVPESEIVKELIAQTRERGAPDNVTIIWVEVVESAVSVHTVAYLGAAK